MDHDGYQIELDAALQFGVDVMGGLQCRSNVVEWYCMSDELHRRVDDGILVWLAINSVATDETVSAVVPT
jgi:hypothetical protein